MSDNSAVEDSLAAAFSSSFSMPAPAPRAAPEPAPEEPVAEPQADADAETEGEAADWRPQYEANLAMWQEEANVARAKAEATRAAIEAEHAAAAASAAAAERATRDAEAQAARGSEREARLAAALADDAPRAGPIHKRGIEDRTAKVKEAWELVKNRDTAPPSTTSVAASASQWEEISAPHSSVEDISAASASAPASAPASSPSGAASQEKAASAGSSGGSGSLVSAPTPSVPAGAASAAPAATGTPSLTLSLFTAPERLSVSRVFAALGINLLLPFINGIMLGLGEITAREGVRAARAWWRGERPLLGYWHRRDASAGSGAAGVAGVGLSGSAGF